MTRSPRARRAVGWTAALAGPPQARRVALVQPGDPLPGPFVLSHRDETVAQLAIHACTVAAPDLTRVPIASSPLGLRRLAWPRVEDLAAVWSGEGRA